MNKYNAAIDRILNTLKTDLLPSLSYHGLYHTEDVVNASKVIGQAEGISNDEMNLLQVAAAFHDSGHLVLYNNHEEASCGIAFPILTELEFSSEEIRQICDMIMATKVPQSPRNKLGRILCDADLDYLGRDDYDEISGALYKEFCEWGILCGQLLWTERQISFLEKHKYWTDYSIANREAKKMQHLTKLRSRLTELKKD